MRKKPEEPLASAGDARRDQTAPGGRGSPEPLAGAPLQRDAPGRLAALGRSRYSIRSQSRIRQPDRCLSNLRYALALIALVARRQWCKARVGLSERETARHVSFCAHAILGSDVFVVPDASADPRFSANPLVREEPKLRFYAGAPLVTSDGYAVGTLCVLDRVPRELSSEQVDALRVLSRQVVAQLELRRRLLAEREHSDERLMMEIGGLSGSEPPGEPGRKG